MRLRHLVLLVTALATLSACGSGGDDKSAKPKSSSAQPGPACGKVTSAAAQPVTLKVMKGTASCDEARRVFTEFFRKIAAGEAPGNGGGGGLTINGWNCGIYTAADIEKNGRGADCKKAGALVTAWHEKAS